MNGAFSLTDLLLQERSVDSRINKVIERSTAESSLTGEALWQTLVASGVNIGVDATKMFFTQLLSRQIFNLRNAIKMLDDSLQFITDDEAYKKVAEVKSAFAKELLDNANVVRGNFATSMVEMYGVPKQYLDGTKDMGSITEQELQCIGLFAMEKAPSYFYAWQAADEDDSLQSYKCRCLVCLTKDRTPKRSMSEAISTGAARYGALDKLLVAFARFLMDEFSSNLSRLIDGVQPYSHDSEDESTDEAVGKVIRGLMGKGK